MLTVWTIYHGSKTQKKETKLSIRNVIRILKFIDFKTVHRNFLLPKRKTEKESPKEELHGWSIFRMFCIYSVGYSPAQLRLNDYYNQRQTFNFIYHFENKVSWADDGLYLPFKIAHSHKQSKKGKKKKKTRFHPINIQYFLSFCRYPLTLVYH